jgi:hypothetical protein
MRKQILVLVQAILLCCSIARADQTPVLHSLTIQADPHTAYEQLLHAPIFSIGPVGFAAQTSESELALNLLLNEKEAVAVLKDLLANATTLAGRMYALYGLYVKDREVFKQELKRYKAERGMEGVVATQSGCIIMPEKEEVVVKKIERGQYGQVLKERPVRK